MQLLATAKTAAYEASKILLENFGKITKNDIIEKRDNDFLTFVDEQAEKIIISIIKDVYPNHAIQAEESGIETGESEYKWIIDPLDGTKNYISGIPIFAISIAVKHKDDIILGVIYDPIRDELYHAMGGKGAFLNDQPIRVNQQKNIKEALIATGFPFRYKNYLTQYLACFEDIFQQVSGIRRMGAAAIDLAYVASGKFEAFWEIALSPWDVAAGTLLITESGGRVSDFWGVDNYLPYEYFIASNNFIHDHLLRLIQTHFKEYKAIES